MKPYLGIPLHFPRFQNFFSPPFFCISSCNFCKMRASARLFAHHTWISGISAVSTPVFYSALIHPYRATCAFQFMLITEHEQLTKTLSNSSIEHMLIYSRVNTIKKIYVYIIPKIYRRNLQYNSTHSKIIANS